MTLLDIELAENTPEVIKAQANFDKALETSKKVKEAATALSNAKSKAKSDYLNSQEYKDKTAAASKYHRERLAELLRDHVMFTKLGY